MTMTTPTPPAFTLGDRLYKARRSARISVGRMADTLHVSRTTISNYEHDRTHPPYTTLERWADLCTVPLWWLLGEDHGPVTARYAGAGMSPPGAPPIGIRLLEPFVPAFAA